MSRHRTADGNQIIERCEGCCLPDVMTGVCTAFSDPDYQWRDGECWGRCDSAKEMVRRLEDVISYNECHGLNTAGVAKMKKELKDWQEAARLLEGGETA